MSNFAQMRTPEMGEERSSAKASFQDMANAVRALSMDAVEKANSGHPGMPMGMADVATVLFAKFLKYDVSAPKWPDRDRFVLSAGHGSMLLYSLLYLTGYSEINLDELKRFRQLGAKTAGHPEYGYAPGIETTTGPLGQGLANAVGMALAERLTNARYGDSICNHYTYVIAGDGCLMEGISHEAIDLAGHLRLNKLIVLFDDNAISIDGSTDLSTSIDQVKRFEASGWAVTRIDGHDPSGISDAIEHARTSDRPSLIACKTLIGKGAPNKQGTAATHGSPLGADEIKATRAHLNWPYEPFEVPSTILSSWRKAGEAGRSAKAKWDEAIASLSPEKRQHYLDAQDGKFASSVHHAIQELKAKWLAEKPKLATRKSSESALQVINDATELTIGGSADLTHSNYTITKGMKSITPEDFSGRYIHYGIREHGMAAAMNGIALHGGFVPYGGTFLVFSDYCRPAIRLSALMHQRVIYVMTHDSIGLGEDGPTHQPVEHLASLRALPNCLVFRPADAVETLEAWECALYAKDRPSILCLTRQNVPALREAEAELALVRDHTAALSQVHLNTPILSKPKDDTGMHDKLTGEETPSLPRGNMTAFGGYLLRETRGKRDITLLATGSEVSLAIEAAERLSAEGIAAAVVSLPSFELFRKQPREYREYVLGKAPRVGIEAAVMSGWHEWLGENGAFIGMNSFGASGPYQELYQHFGITTEAVVTAAKRLIV